ncbi:MAG: hypothetical protein KKB70_12285 [Proteobacteria bacterium]|nr:hypothetical protein [Pseudomonadota bacterium]
MSAKSRRHEVVLVVTFDKPCTKRQAVAMVKDCVHDDFYPIPVMGAEKMRVVTAKSTFKVKKGGA